MIRLPEGRLARALLLGGVLALPVVAFVFLREFVLLEKDERPTDAYSLSLSSSATGRDVELVEAERAAARAAVAEAEQTRRLAYSEWLSHPPRLSASDEKPTPRQHSKSHGRKAARRAGSKASEPSGGAAELIMRQPSSNEEDETDKSAAYYERLLRAESRLALVEMPTVDEALKRLRTARVAFNVPESGRATKPFLFEAKLSARLPAEDLAREVREVGKTETAELKISNRMAATLVGGGFDIAPSGPQEQWISDREPTTWTWTVTPKAVGRKQVLVLGFDAMITIDGKDDRRTVNTFKREIDIDVAWPETVPEWLELVKKTGENASWIWATLLIPIGGAAWGWATGNKPEKQKPETKPSDKTGDSAPARAAPPSPVADPEHVDPSGSA